MISFSGIPLPMSRSYRARCAFTRATSSLGLNGLVVKTHGSAKAKEVTNTIIQCVTFKQQNISEKIKASIQAEEAAAE